MSCKVISNQDREPIQSRDDVIGQQAHVISLMNEDEVRAQAAMSRAATQLVDFRPSLTYVQAESQQVMSRCPEVQRAMDVFIDEWVSLEMTDLANAGVQDISRATLVKDYLSRMVY